MLHQRDAARDRGGLAHQWPGVGRLIGQQHLELEVLGEGQTIFEIDGAALVVQRPASLAGRLHLRGDAMSIPHQEGGEIHQGAAVRLQGGDLTAPEHGGGEGLAHRLPLGGVLGEGAELQVRHLHQHAPAPPGAGR